MNRALRLTLLSVAVVVVVLLVVTMWLTLPTNPNEATVPVDQVRDWLDWGADWAQMAGALLALVALVFALRGLVEARAASKLAEQTAGAAEKAARATGQLAETAREELALLRAAGTADLRVEQHWTKRIGGEWSVRAMVRNRGPSSAYDLEVWVADEQGTPLSLPRLHSVTGIEAGELVQLRAALPREPDGTSQLWVTWGDARGQQERDTGTRI